jgi:hypothetical protein
MAYFLPADDAIAAVRSHLERVNWELRPPYRPVEMTVAGADLVVRFHYQATPSCSPFGSRSICQIAGLDDAAPFVDARLPDGSRVHAVLGCSAPPGTCISLRVPAQRSFSLEDCIASGSLTPAAAPLLSRMIEAKLAFLISGGTCSGKDDTAVKTLLGERSRQIRTVRPPCEQTPCPACANVGPGAC